MGFHREQYPRRVFQNPTKKENLFRNIHSDLFKTLSINQDSKGKVNFDENNFVSLAEDLSNELQREYPLIMSIYKLEDHYEIDRSDTNSTKTINWDQVSFETYDGIKNINLGLEWKVTSKESKDIYVLLNIQSLSDNYTWNFRKKDAHLPTEFAMSIPSSSNLKLLWNEDYCLDIAKPGGEIVSIWLSTRDYTE